MYVREGFRVEIDIFFFVFDHFFSANRRCGVADAFYDLIPQDSDINLKEFEICVIPYMYNRSLASGLSSKGCVYCIVFMVKQSRPLHGCSPNHNNTQAIKRT